MATVTIKSIKNQKISNIKRAAVIAGFGGIDGYYAIDRSRRNALEQERAAKDRLAARLRQLGIDPDE